MEPGWISPNCSVLGEGYNMREKIIAGAVVALGLLSSPAYAVVPIPLGPLDPDTFDSATLSGGKLPASGTFQIEYTFTLTTTGYVEPVISFTSAKAPGRLPTSPVFSLFAGGTAPADLMRVGASSVRYDYQYRCNPAYGRRACGYNVLLGPVRDKSWKLVRRRSRIDGAGPRARNLGDVAARVRGPRLCGLPSRSKRCGDRSLRMIACRSQRSKGPPARRPFL